MSARERFVAGLSAALLAGLLLATAALSAQEASGAQLAYERGAQLYSQRKLEQAVEAFLDSYRLVPNANVAFNIAQTCALLGRNDEAFNWYQTHLGFPLDAAAQQRAKERIDALASKVAVVEVRTHPTGAALFVDRVELGSLGVSPRRLAVPAGQRAVIARLPGYEHAVATVEATIGKIVVVTPELLPATGRVEILSKPAGARVSLAADGHALGETPTLFHGPVGEHKLVLALEHHVTQEIVVKVERGAVASARVSLERDPASFARLSLSGELGTEVFVDGRYVGTVPTAPLELVPGRHSLRLRDDVALPWESHVHLERGATASYRVTREGGEAGIGNYRWLGYGAAAALLIAAGGFGLAALDENDRVSKTPGADVSKRDGLNIAADVSLGAGVLIGAATLVADLLVGSGERARVVLQRVDSANGAIR